MVLADCSWYVSQIVTLKSGHKNLYTIADKAGPNPAAAVTEDRLTQKSDAAPALHEPESDKKHYYMDAKGEDYYTFLL